MAINEFGYAGGITSLLIVGFGFLCATIFFIRFKQTRRTESLLQGIVFIAVGSAWLGVLSGFLAALRGVILSASTIIRIWGWAPAIIATVWIYLVLSVLKPYLKHWGLVLCGILNAIYLYLVYTKTDQYSTTQIVGGIPDSSMTGLAALFLVIHIFIILLVIGPAYLYIGFNSERPEIQLQGKVVGLGVVTFSAFAILDSAVLLSSVGSVIFVRAVLMISILFVYLGFSLPEWFLNRFVK